jgi:hypothetical protein
MQMERGDQHGGCQGAAENGEEAGEVRVGVPGGGVDGDGDGP